MKNSLITAFEQRVFANRKKHPAFRPGDTVRISYKIQEGADKEKFRTQVFEGVVVSFKKGTADSSFTVRKIGANGVGVERCFPLYSPYVDQIDLIASGIVRRARLYYLRDLSGKAARIRSKFHGGAGKSKVLIPGAEQLAQPAEAITPELSPEAAASMAKAEAAKAAKAAEETKPS